MTGLKNLSQDPWQECEQGDYSVGLLLASLTFSRNEHLFGMGGNSYPNYLTLTEEKNMKLAKILAGVALSIASASALASNLPVIQTLQRYLPQGTYTGQTQTGSCQVTVENFWTGNGELGARISARASHLRGVSVTLYSVLPSYIGDENDYRMLSRKLPNGYYVEQTVPSFSDAVERQTLRVLGLTNGYPKSVVITSQGIDGSTTTDLASVACFGLRRWR